jgi:type II secretory pathway pseudopilin PulG
MIEMMIVVFVLIILGSLVYRMVSNSGEGADQHALAHVTKLFPGAQDIRTACGGYDSDLDNYVRCTATWLNPVPGLAEAPRRESLEMECNLLTGDCVPVKPRARGWGY